MKQRKFIKCHFEQGQNADEIKEKLDIHLGHEAYFISTVYRKKSLLKCGNTNLEDTPKTGNGLKILKRISEMFEEKPYSTIRYIDNIQNSKESMVYRFLTLYLHKKYIHTRWITY